MVEVINPIYLEAATIQRIHNHFHRDPVFQSATLSDYFSEEALAYFQQQIQELDFAEDTNHIIHRRQTAEVPEGISTFLQSDIFKEFSERVVGEPVDFSSAQLHRYRHRDYRIIHDEAVLEPGYDLIIDLTPDWGDEMGGYIHYTDGEGEFYAIDSSYGSLSIIKRTENWHYYVKYVNHYAENRSRYLVIANTTVG